ncbi:unnamed protein product, partial [Symbiodinium sp. CCMP2456]
PEVGRCLFRGPAAAAGDFDGILCTVLCPWDHQMHGLHLCPEGTADEPEGVEESGREQGIDRGSGGGPGCDAQSGSTDCE